ncbi:MAG: GTP 3',8-cyclase MoaA [Gemmatirosa sp.]|nr:GTP 3',8-cyclase MoaA [Gemmatirosa sp.]
MTMVAPSPVLRDQFGRGIEYLRISVTDRCNLRCVYCMPAGGLPWIPREQTLTADEIGRLVRELAPIGLRRVRLTGGEPTLRPDLERIVRLIRDVPDVEDIALSTNGVRMCQQPGVAARLRDAGLDRVNLSADSLRADRVAAMGRRDLGFDAVAAASIVESAGLTPVKLNVVVIRGENDDEIEEFARLTLRHAWHVRFIELMPVGELAEARAASGGSPLDLVVPSDEILSRLAALGRALGRPLAADDAAVRGNGPAAYHRFDGAPGRVGVITPMTHTYCGSCNRVRLTADGRLRTCLYGDHEVMLRDALRRGEPLAPLVHAALADKPLEHALLVRRVGGLRALSQVGG